MKFIGMNSAIGILPAELMGSLRDLVQDERELSEKLLLSQNTTIYDHSSMIIQATPDTIVFCDVCYI